MKTRKEKTYVYNKVVDENDNIIMIYWKKTFAQ